MAQAGRGDTLDVPWLMLEQRRSMGCQYMNTHCKAISDVFNCNTNIKIGDRSQVFYSTLYCGKSTQSCLSNVKWRSVSRTSVFPQDGSFT